MSYFYNFLLYSNFIIGALIIISIMLSNIGSDSIISNSGNKSIPGSVDYFKNKFVAVLSTLFLVNILALGYLSIDRTSPFFLKKNAIKSETGKAIQDK